MNFSSSKIQKRELLRFAQETRGYVVFFDVYCELCKEKGISPTGAALEMGISRGAVSAWKNEARVPSSAILTKIADYFGVSVDYLLGNGKSPADTGEVDKKNKDNTKPRDPAIRRIERARNRMPEAQKQQMMTLLKIAFDDYFSDDFVNEDTDE